VTSSPRFTRVLNTARGEAALEPLGVSRGRDLSLERTGGFDIVDFATGPRRVI
jgi:hypothetical protein